MSFGSGPSRAHSSRERMSSVIGCPRALGERTATARACEVRAMSKSIEALRGAARPPLDPGTVVEATVQSYGLAPFRMVSDSRARRVARDLRDLLKSEGVGVSLTRAQALTANLYGYGSWPALLADLGADFSLDDPDESEDEVDGRFRRALGVVLGALPSLPAAQRLLAALQPTNRANVAAQRATLVELANPDAYHPVRLKRLVEETEEVLCAFQDLERDVGGPFTDADAIERSGRAAHDVVEAAIAGEDLTLLPYDAYAVLQRRLLPLYAAATRVETSACAIVDAEAVSLDLAARVIPDLSASADHYVHLGALRFPSPYPGLGIEGCYVRTGADGDVVISAVLSPPAFGPDAESYLDGFSIPTMLLAHARGHTMRLAEIIDGGLAVNLPPVADILAIGSFDAQGRPPFVAGLDALWRTCLRPAAAAAVNAVVQAGQRAPGERLLGVAVPADHALARRIAKARTPQQTEAALAALREEAAGPVVQILGTTPTSAETGYIPDALPHAPAFWPTMHGEAWLAFFVRGGTSEYDFEESADLIYDYARLVAPDRARFLALAPAAQAQVVEAGLAFITRLMMAEDSVAAREVADEMLALRTSEDPRFHAYKAFLLIEDGLDGEVDAALAMLAETDPAAAAWLAFHRAHLRQEGDAARLLRVAYEADIPLAEALHRALDEEGSDLPEGLLAPAGVIRGVQLLGPLLVELRPAITDLLRSLRLAPRTSQARH